ncbi:TonB-dependent receptor [Asticcacaulis machinosus]|uniref:TonB-dependent receptor n=1 Tax=Asticcacaulis machinosus TaxID=2984211 RepID=A0ABT5HLR6_9CAUL|nr:TonB-dependent receptor [Asticcacaulis machinosus]MDC7677191.1 TonB-dependent receptor [Asticcacaulis machinosus]
MFSNLTTFTFKAAALAGVSLLAVSATGALAADPAPEPAVADEDITEVVIYAPIRDSQIAALREQRNADNLVNIIASDTVGRFPDQNSAAALSRLPAVAVQRDQGQERYIQVRGAPNRWTSVSFDGVTVIGVDEGGSSRAFRFDAVPAVILQSIAVNKSLTPDLPAEAVVAQIDLKTYSPFHKNGFDLQGELGLGEMELGGGQQQQGSLRTTWSNGTFGVVAGASHYSRNQVTDNREFAYDARGLSSFDARNYLLHRENNGASLGFEWRPAEGHKLFLKTVYSEFKDDEERNHYTFQLANALSGTRTETGGDLVGVPVRSTAEYGEYRTRNTLTTLGGDHEFGENWNLDWRLNATKMENTTYLPLLMQQQASPLQRVSMTYSLSDPNFPNVSLFRTAAGTTAGTYVRGAALTALDQSAFSINIAIPITSNIKADNWTAKADLTHESGAWTYKTGFQYDSRDIEGNVIGQPVVVLTTGLPAGTDLRAANYVSTKAWSTGFPLGFTINYLDNQRLRTDMEGKLAVMQSLGRYNPANNIAKSDMYSIAEKLTAGYGMAKVEFNTWQVVFGARVENMKQTIKGFTNAAGVITPVEVETDYTDFFPSVNAKFDLNEKLVFRGSAQRGIARPSFGAVRAGASINDTATPGTITGGNPYLEPEYTWGGDASLEYYPSTDSVLSVSGFYRHVENVLYDSRTKITDDRYDGNGIDRTGYDFTSTLNGDEGKLYGLEFNYQQRFAMLPSPFDGLGFQGNVAVLDGAFDTAARKDVPFPGTSDTIVNTSIYYEKYGLSARLSYQWRDDWADTLGGLGLGSGGDEYRKGYENLDLTLRYAVNPNLTVYADASNLTDETYIAYEGDLSHPSEVEQIGRRFMAGIRFNF